MNIPAEKFEPFTHVFHGNGLLFVYRVIVVVGVYDPSPANILATFVFTSIVEGDRFTVEKNRTELPD